MHATATSVTMELAMIRIILILVAGFDVQELFFLAELLAAQGDVSRIRLAHLAWEARMKHAKNASNKRSFSLKE